MSKRVFSYLRVSGKGQVEGDGFPRQREAIQKFCESQGWVIAREFADEGVSGTIECGERPKFAELIEACGDIDTVVIENADRLARDVFVSELFYREARAAGLKIYTANTGTEQVNGEAEADPSRTMIRQIFAVIAQYEKCNLVRKLRAARLRIRAREGRCEGIEPYELTAHGAPVARMIWDSHIEGNSFSQIRDWLNNRNIPSPAGVKWTRGAAHCISQRFSQLNKKLHPPGPVPCLTNFPGAPTVAV